MSVGRICSRVVATASPTENVMTAAQRMADNDVGTLVVVEGGPPRYSHRSGHYDQMRRRPARSGRDHDRGGHVEPASCCGRAGANRRRCCAPSAAGG